MEKTYYIYCGTEMSDIMEFIKMIMDMCLSFEYDNEDYEMCDICRLNFWRLILILGNILRSLALYKEKRIKFIYPA